MTTLRASLSLYSVTSPPPPTVNKPIFPVPIKDYLLVITAHTNMLVDTMIGFKEIGKHAVREAKHIEEVNRVCP
jgi:hypothetical protein